VIGRLEGWTEGAHLTSHRHCAVVTASKEHEQQQTFTTAIMSFLFRWFESVVSPDPGQDRVNAAA